MCPVLLKRVLCLIFLQKKLSLGAEAALWKVEGNELEEIVPQTTLLSGKMVIPYEAGLWESSPTQVQETQGFIQLTVLS